MLARVRLGLGLSLERIDEAGADAVEAGIELTQPKRAALSIPKHHVHLLRVDALDLSDALAIKAKLFYGFPLKLVPAAGSPVRAVGIVND